MRRPLLLERGLPPQGGTNDTAFYLGGLTLVCVVRVLGWVRVGGRQLAVRKDIQMILRKTFRFEASHILPRHPGKCSRLHGHSWTLYVYVEGTPDNETGFVMDYGDIKAAVQPIIDEELDHYHLNTSLGIYPSSEMILYWIGMRLKAKEFPWSKLALEETCTAYAELTREEFNRDHTTD
jgi:6-pyruvoyltetrahydropterin/6-carboxytetrahydropterin synthase